MEWERFYEIFKNDLLGLFHTVGQAHQTNIRNLYNSSNTSDISEKSVRDQSRSYTLGLRTGILTELEFKENPGEDDILVRIPNEPNIQTRYL